MPFPGFPLDASKTNATPTTNDHPDHHNDLATAANDLQGQVDALALEDADLQSQISALTAIVNLMVHPGFIVAYSGPSAPAGWVLMGTTLVNGVATHPALWAATPASWHFVNDLVLPSDVDRMFMGGGVLGATGGSNTVTLAETNLGPHAHGLNSHVHTMSGHTHLQTHTHDIDHDHAAFNTALGGDHSHLGRFLNVFNPGAGAAYGAFVNSVSAFSGSGQLNWGGIDGDHLHQINVPLSAGLLSGAANPGSTGGPSVANTGAATGNTASAGSATPFSVTNAHIRVNHIIKA